MAPSLINSLRIFYYFANLKQMKPQLGFYKIFGEKEGWVNVGSAEA